MDIVEISKFCATNVVLGPHEAMLVDAVLKENVPDFIVFYSGGGLMKEEKNGFGFVNEQMNKVIEKANNQINALEEFKENAKMWIDLQKDHIFDLSDESVRANLVKVMAGLLKNVSSDGFMSEVLLPGLRVRAFREVVEIRDGELIFHKVNRTKAKFLTKVVTQLQTPKSNPLAGFDRPRWIAIPKHVDMGAGKANVMSQGVYSKVSFQIQFDTWKCKEDVWIKSSGSVMRGKQFN